MRSPRSIPEACIARATRVASRAKSRYVERRSPCTIAVLSGYPSAERSRKRNGVNGVSDVADIRTPLLEMWDRQQSAGRQLLAVNSSAIQVTGPPPAYARLTRP